jgi:hypothetical protein
MPRQSWVIIAINPMICVWHPAELAAKVVKDSAVGHGYVQQKFTRKTTKRVFEEEETTGH